MIAAQPPLHREGQGVTAGFAGNPQIAAGLSPLRTVRRDPSATGPELGEQMRKLMPEGAIKLSRAMFLQSWIERD
jgi:hypothetical protein